MGNKSKKNNYNANQFMLHPRSESLKRKSESPGGEPRKAARLNTDGLREKVESFIDEFQTKPKNGQNNDNVARLFMAVSVLSTMVIELVDEVETLQTESKASSTNYAKVVADNAKIRKDNERIGLGKELEDADKTAKIIDLGFTCKNNEIGDLPKKIREKLAEDPVIKNWLHDSLISPIFPEGKPSKNDKDKDLKVGCLIKCKSTDNKQSLIKTINEKFPDFNVRYHFPSKLMKYVKKIREDFKNIKTSDFDPKNAHLLIRPNRNYNGLNLKYRKKQGDGWTFIGNVDLVTDFSDEGLDDLILPHCPLFKKLETEIESAQ